MQNIPAICGFIYITTILKKGYVVVFQKKLGYSDSLWYSSSKNDGLHCGGSHASALEKTLVCAGNLI